MTEPGQERRRRRLSAEDRRLQVLEVTTRMVSERGYWGTSVREVAAACGVTVGAVLHHFSTKEALLLAVLEHRDRAGVAAVEQAFGPPSTWWDPPAVTLADICADLVARNAQEPEIVRLYSVLAAEALDPAHPAHDYFVTRQKWVLDGFALLAPEGSDRASVAAQALALLDGLQLQWLRDPSRDWPADWRRATAGIPELRPSEPGRVRRLDP